VQSSDGRAYLLFYIRDQALDISDVTVSSPPIIRSSVVTVGFQYRRLASAPRLLRRPGLLKCRRIKFLRILFSETVNKIINKTGVRNKFYVLIGLTVRLCDNSDTDCQYHVSDNLVFSTWDPRLGYFDKLEQSRIMEHKNMMSKNTIFRIST